VAALPNFRIDTARTGSVTTMRLSGELDSATSPRLLEALERLADAGGAQALVLDLADVSFIDSAGMRTIITVERIARERDISLTISPASGPVTDLLQMTGLGEHVALAPHGEDRSPGRFIERIELELVREPTAPGRARAELREAFGDRLGGTDCSTLTLLTSELVTNAVIHPDPAAGGTISLRITAYADRVHIEVTDAGSGFDPATLPPRPREAGGHGLVVVEGLSSRWGTRRARLDDGEGFCVWFELDLESAFDDVPAEPSVAAAEG
jgi:anti-sigma B factor antagonist